MTLTPRQAVYALARTQLDWMPSTIRSRPATAGFAHGRDAKGRILRWLSCPDCLANGFVSTGCETCHGHGEIPDGGRDPYEVKAAGGAAFFGEDRERQRDRARWLDAQLLELRRQHRIREGDDDPEDWFARAVRLKKALWARGDYELLHQAQQLLAATRPLRHLAWMTFVVEQQPLSLASQATVRLDETADWLAGKMTGAIDRAVALQRARQLDLGVPERRIRTRPGFIVVPDEHQRELADAAAGKGRWANPGSQADRNALVAELDGAGLTAGEIARRTGLSKRRVQQIVAQLRATVATGPAA